MKKPMVDYREFRLSRINEERFSHLKYLLGWIGYFCLYFITERFIPRETCYVIYSPLDDIVPFCELFAIPYVFWYMLIVLTLLYFALYNTEGFKRFQTFIIVTQVVAMVIYIIFPNRQDLRPTEFERNNILTQLMSLIYSVDTSTNVCPSLHVAYSIGIASAWIKEKGISLTIKVSVTIFCIIICLSTAFVKQHSVVDIFAALPVCVLAEIIAYGKTHYFTNKSKTP